MKKLDYADSRWLVAKKGFNYAGGCRHLFCGNATGAFSAFFRP
ncbi:hypothetical protein ACP059_07275 [Bacillus cabrialesii]